MDRGNVVLWFGALALGGCSLLDTVQTECSYRRPCSGGRTCDPATSTCVGSVASDLAVAMDLTTSVAPVGMVTIPGRTVLLGNTTATDPQAQSDESPIYSITLPTFFLDRTEVTVAAYRACLAATGEGDAGIGCTTPSTGGNCTWTASAGAMENYPISCVDWHQATAYCTWAKKRLPTEAEWEYAARGGTNEMVGSEYPWGSAAPGSQACWNTNAPCPVDHYQRTLLGTNNNDGLADMAGGVYEWTSTQYCTYVVDGGTNNCNGSYVIRGGSWVNIDTVSLRAADRYSYDAAVQNHNFGFRCAQD